MKYLKEYNNFSVDQIKMGIKKSISNKDIELKTNINSIIDNIKRCSFEVGSIEYFLYDNNNNFISEAIPDKLIKYINDNELDIDIQNLIDYNEKKKELDKISDRIAFFDKSYSDDKSKLTELYIKEEELEKYDDLLKSEVLKIKSEILDKYPY